MRRITFGFLYEIAAISGSRGMYRSYGVRAVSESGPGDDESTRTLFCGAGANSDARTVG